MATFAFSGHIVVDAVDRAGALRLFADYFTRISELPSGEQPDVAYVQDAEIAVFEAESIEQAQSGEAQTLHNNPNDAEQVLASVIHRAALAGFISHGDEPSSGSITYDGEVFTKMAQRWLQSNAPIGTPGNGALQVDDRLLGVPDIKH